MDLLLINVQCSMIYSEQFGSSGKLRVVYSTHEPHGAFFTAAAMFLNILKTVLGILILQWIPNVESKIYANYYNCATFRMANNFAELFTQLDCEPLMPLVARCCKGHFNCYDKGGRKERCDSLGCDCMAAAVKKNPTCKNHIGVFCGNIRADTITHGEMAKARQIAKQKLEKAKKEKKEKKPKKGKSG